jgi:hypothetical protein
MAENHENPGNEDELEPMMPTEREIPTDYFDDAAERKAAIAAKSPGPPSPPPLNFALTPPPVEETSRKSVFPMIMGVLCLATLGLAAYFNMQKQPVAAPNVATNPPSASAATSSVQTGGAMLAAASAAPTGAESEKFKSLESTLEGVSAQVKELAAKLHALPKPDTATDLKPIEGKIEELSKSLATVTPLTEKVEKLYERLSTIDSGLKTLKEDLGTLKDEVRKTAEATVVTARPAADEGAAAYSQGTDLFKVGKYKDANEAFKKLEASPPRDARYYYFAALARGLGTGVWTGETEELVKKGVDLEKAGTPPASEIDAAFANVPAIVKPWLTGHRAYAKVK